MQLGELKQGQKDMVWRYAHSAGLWRRKQSRNFATLESDMTAGYETVADGITVGARSGCPILSDAKDPASFAAIFREDNAAIPDMRALDLERLRRFIIDGEGELPMPPPRLTEPTIRSEPLLPHGSLER